jgi:hypothetical protein
VGVGGSLIRRRRGALQRNRPLRYTP